MHEHREKMINDDRIEIKEGMLRGQSSLLTDFDFEKA